MRANILGYPNAHAKERVGTHAKEHAEERERGHGEIGVCSVDAVQQSGDHRAELLTSSVLSERYEVNKARLGVRNAPSHCHTAGYRRHYCSAHPHYEYHRRQRSSVRPRHHQLLQEVQQHV